MTKSEFLTWSDLAVEFCDVAITGKIGIDECEEKIKENVIKKYNVVEKTRKNQYYAKKIISILIIILDKY